MRSSRTGRVRLADRGPCPLFSFSFPGRVGTRATTVANGMGAQYCNNVLLQEAVLQLLLWRTGQRTALGLLEPEEEARLHTRAMEEGEKTNWVHDIIRMRQAMEKTMLPGSKGTGDAKGKANTSDAGGGTGTTRTGRTRRGA